MDWLTAHRVVINCNRMRVIAYTLDGNCVTFQGDKHDALLQAMYDSRWHERLVGWLESLTLEDKARQDLGLPWVVCEYEDVFSDELLGLPPYRNVDFIIELLLGYGQNIQSDWNINAAEFKSFYPLTHQGSHAFHKNRRKGKQNLPLVDQFVKPLKSAS